MQHCALVCLWWLGLTDLWWYICTVKLRSLCMFACQLTLLRLGLSRFGRTRSRFLLPTCGHAQQKKNSKP